jgi:hypothetical protein
VLARLRPSLRDDPLPASFSSALTTPWPILHDTFLLVIFSHLLTFPHWQGSGRAFVMIFPPPGTGTGMEQPVMEQCMMHKKTAVPIWFEPTSDSPLPVSLTLSHIRKDRCVGACGAVYCLKRCTCMSDLRSQKRPLHLLCLYPNAMVPIQFELKLEGHWPVADMSLPLQDRYIGACGAVYLP